MEINAVNTTAVSSADPTGNRAGVNDKAAETQPLNQPARKNVEIGPAYQVTLSTDAQEMSAPSETEAAPPADSATTYNNMGEIVG